MSTFTSKTPIIRFTWRELDQPNDTFYMYTMIVNSAFTQQAFDFTVMVIKKNPNVVLDSLEWSYSST